MHCMCAWLSMLSLLSTWPNAELRELPAIQQVAAVTPSFFQASPKHRPELWPAGMLLQDSSSSLFQFAKTHAHMEAPVPRVPGPWGPWEPFPDVGEWVGSPDFFVACTSASFGMPSSEMRWMIRCMAAPGLTLHWLPAAASRSVRCRCWYHLSKTRVPQINSLRRRRRSSQRPRSQRRSGRMGLQMADLNGAKHVQVPISYRRRRLRSCRDCVAAL